MEGKTRRMSPPNIEHEIGVTVRFDLPTLKEIDRIALFEREKRAVLLRRIIIDKVKVYERNPAYKRFLRQLEETNKKHHDLA